MQTESACLTGCTIQTSVFNDTTSRPPLPPPVLTSLVESQNRLDYSINISDIVPYPLTVNHVSELVGFLLKIEVNNEEYFWFQVRD